MVEVDIAEAEGDCAFRLRESGAEEIGAKGDGGGDRSFPMDNGMFAVYNSLARCGYDEGWC